MRRKIILALVNSATLAAIVAALIQCGRAVR